MKIKDRILNTLNLTTKQEAAARADRAYEAGYMDINDEPPSGTLRSYGYRRQTAKHLRDLKTGYHKIIENVWLMYQSNPVAKRMLRIKVSHFLGGGIEYSTEDETLQELLDEFRDRNNLNSQIRKFSLQLRLFGEQCYPTFVRKVDGRVNLGYIDPGQIEAIIMHPDNAMWPWAVVLKDDAITSIKRVYRIVRKDDDFVVDINGEQRVQQARNPGLLVTHEQTNLQPWEAKMLKVYGNAGYSGSCLLFQINNVSNQGRGFSDLLQSVDWIDALDETFFAVGEREQFAAYFSWFVKLIGASKDDVRKRTAEIQKRKPSRGSVNVSNDMEEWELKVADLKQMGSIETVKALLAYILGGLGIPFVWFGFGDGTNRATALAQGDPTTKTLEEEQDEIRDMIVTILTFVRDQAIIAGTLPSEAAEKMIEITMPQMTKKDLQTLTGSMSQLASSLMIAEQQGWSSKEQAINIWQKMVQEFGIESEDVQELLDELEQEEEEAPPIPEPFMANDEDMETAEQANEWLNNRLNGNSSADVRQKE